MPWNGVIGRPWEDWELDILLTGRTQNPPVPYKELLKKLPSDRTWRGAARVVQDYGLTKKENRATARNKYPGRESEIFAAMQLCALDKGMCREDARKWLSSVKGVEFSRAAFNTRVKKLGDSKDKEKREVYQAFVENGKRVASLRIGLHKKRQYIREGIPQLNRGGTHRGQHTRSKSKGQDQETNTEARGVLRASGNAGDGAERHT